MTTPDDPTEVMNRTKGTPAPEAPSSPESLAEKRRRAQNVLWWRVQTQSVLQVLFVILLVLDALLGATLVFAAWSESRGALDLGSRLFGDAEEAAWLGWTAYFAWVFSDRMNRARKSRRSARIARILLKRGHPRWFYPLAAS